MSSLRKLYLTGTVILIILIIFIFAVILPLIREIKGASNEYIEVRDALAKMGEEIKLLGFQKKLLEDAHFNLSGLDKAFLKQNQEKVAEFFSDLESVARKTGISIEIKSATSPTEDKPYFTFQIFLKGNFSDLVRFIAALEDSPEDSYRLIDVRNLTMQRVIKENKLIVEASLEIWVYTE